MEAKISNAQLEVWEWKENLSKELKDIPRGKKLEYIENKVKQTVEYLEKERQHA